MIFFLAQLFCGVGLIPAFVFVVVDFADSLPLWKEQKKFKYI